MKILVATAEGQGGRADDFFHADEGEIVMPVMACDQTHEACACHRAMVGVRTGRETTTAIVVESDMTRAEYRRAIREAGNSKELAELKVPAEIFDAQAEEYLRLAAALPLGVVIERDGDDFNPRGHAGVAAD
jgi:hypothetical protein